MRELTEQEKEVIDLTAELWNKIRLLPELDPMDNSETCRDIHDIQNRIFARPVAEEMQKLKHERQRNSGS